MNLHGIVASAVGTVNPPTAVTILQAIGTYTTAADGTRTPNYTIISGKTGQRQALTGKDLYTLNNLGIQGVVEKIYLAGNYEGIFRVTGKGGDLIKFGGQTYLVAAVLERWPDWCALALTQQMDGP